MFKLISRITSWSYAVALYLFIYVVMDVLNDTVNSKTILCAVFLSGISILAKLEQNKTIETTIDIKE